MTDGLSLIFRHYRARARLKAHKARGQEILRLMREEWQVKKTWAAGLAYTKDYEGHKAGDVACNTLVIGEENGMGERRIRIDNTGQWNVETFKQRHNDYHKARLWELKQGEEDNE